MIFKKGDFSHPQVQELIRIHLYGMHQNTPIENSFALNLDSLQKDSISFYTLWNEDKLLGCGAIQELTHQHAELKSMRTHPNYLRNGVATQILDYLLRIAKQRQYQKISLETGKDSNFDAAIHLYKKFGFIQGAAFAEYTESEYSQFFHLDLSNK
ncbi:GNAT family N-acetyltransferase [Acinetobacter sp. 3657]|uniref:GNAT family N-acetyltransferase n=1 Tax=Acinetobacter sp. 3657 TaxID=2817764 RepID=UPI00286316FC|nr:putative acetyltransferase [Prolinoborus sp. 3657]